MPDPQLHQSKVRVNDRDHASGPGQQTLGEAIVSAHRAVAAAEAERARLIGLALDQGATVREVAPLLGVAFSTAWRWAGGRRARRDVLGRPL